MWCSLNMHVFVLCVYSARHTDELRTRFAFFVFKFCFVCLGWRQIKHQIPPDWFFMWSIHRWPMRWILLLNGPVIRRESWHHHGMYGNTEVTRCDGSNLLNPCIYLNYRELFSTTRTDSPNLTDSPLALHMFVPNPLKPGVKPRMKM